MKNFMKEYDKNIGGCMKNTLKGIIAFVLLLYTLSPVYGKCIDIGFGGTGEYAVWSGKNIFSLYPVVSFRYGKIEWQTRIGESIIEFSPIFGMPRLRTGFTGNIGNSIYLSGGINEEMINYFGEWKYYPLFSIGVGFHNKSVHYRLNIVKSFELENYLGFECEILFFPSNKKEGR